MDTNEVRAEFAHEIGCKLDDMLDAAKLDAARDEGAKNALQALVKRISELGLLVDKEMDEGLFSGVDGPMSVAAAIKKYIVRASAVLESGALQAESHRLMCCGRVQTLELIVGNMKKTYDMELGKAALRKEAVENGLPSHGRASGETPNLTLKERRRLEEDEVIQPAISAAVVNSPPIEAKPVKAAAKSTKISKDKPRVA